MNVVCFILVAGWASVWEFVKCLYWNTEINNEIHSHYIFMHDVRSQLSCTVIAVHKPLKLNSQDVFSVCLIPVTSLKGNTVTYLPN